MKYVIGENCICCGSCEASCPSGAVSLVDDHFVISPELCEHCGTCAELCPMEAISTIE